MSNEFWRLIAAFGGGAVLMAILLKVVGKWIADRAATAVDSYVKHDYDRKLEDLRADLTARQGILAAALSAAHAGHMAGHERRMVAVEKLWETVLAVREAASAILFPYDILVPSEYDMPFKNPNIGGGIPHDDLKLFAPYKQFHALDPHRPFLGTELWTLFWIHRAVCLRICVRAIHGRKVSRLPRWDREEDGKSSYVPELLAKVLTPEEMSWVQSRELGAPRVAVDLIEQHILAACDRWQSGATTADVSLNEGKRLAEALRFAKDHLETRP